MHNRTHGMNFGVSSLKVGELGGNAEAEEEGPHDMVVGEVVGVSTGVGYGCYDSWRLWHGDATKDLSG